jgi:hypothetical protein
VLGALRGLRAAKRLRLAMGIGRNVYDGLGGNLKR